MYVQTAGLTSQSHPSIAHTQHTGHTEQSEKSSDADGRRHPREPARTDLNTGHLLRELKNIKQQSSYQSNLLGPYIQEFGCSFREMFRRPASFPPLML